MLTLEQMQGQEIFIETMNLEKQDRKLTLSFTATCKDQTCDLIFRNVSSLNIRNLSYPLQISGFDIVDHLPEGWQSALRYEVCDFEDGSIRFFCETVEVK